MDIHRGSSGTQTVARTVDTAFSVSHGATVKNVSVTATTYTGSNSVSSTGNQEDTMITTAEADSATTADDLANASNTSVTVDVEGTTNDHVNDITRNSTGTLTNTDQIGGSDSTIQNVDNGNSSAATSNTGSNAVSSGGTLKRTTITTAVGNSAAMATTTFSTHARVVTRIQK